MDLLIRRARPSDKRDVLGAVRTMWSWAGFTTPWSGETYLYEKRIRQRSA